MNEQEKRLKVLEIAAYYVGTKESPPNSNNVLFNTRFYGHEVRDGIALNGKPDKNAAYPWCGTSVSEIFQEAKLPLGRIGWMRGFAGCPYALENMHKWGVEVKFEHAQPGDVVFYDWQCDGKWDHVGVLKSKYIVTKDIHVYEGNTARPKSKDPKVMHSSNSIGGEFM
ncbi:MAG: CHAP domain-containing protein, partial [Legionella sp.]|nr:CHAP domain-containing protein [Legionella sp.]